MKEKFAIPVVCVIVEQDSPAGEKRILMQIRRKAVGKQTTVYPGVWELPQGKIRAGETIFEAGCRELEEETGLHASALMGDHRDTSRHILASQTEAIKPLICTVDTTYSYIGIGIIVQAAGAVQHTNEASNHVWLTEHEIDYLIRCNHVFPLNVPIIQEYFRREAL